MRIDLRSDTITKPTESMRKAMALAEVGDDVFAEDPTVNRLQEMLAGMFGMEAGLFCASGTQTNQIAIQVHVRPGDEVICSSTAHVYLYEGGGIARNAGASVRLIEGDRGRINAKEVAANVNNRADAHLPYTSLVCLEDTANKGGGAVYDHREIQKIAEVCSEKNLMLHLDGARVFNSLAVTGMSPSVYAKPFDSISICLSKGLGAPVGSVLLGSHEFIKKAHRVRKVMGGGMRQAGIIAAGAIHALEHHLPLLHEDHRRARIIGDTLASLPWVKEVMPVETNIVIFSVGNGKSGAEAVQVLARHDIHCFPFGPDKVRFVTHLDFTEEHLSHLLNKLTLVQF